MKFRSYAPFGGLLLVLVAAWLTYYPGVHGPFLFDDFANLPALGNTGPVVDWASFARYITSGSADPTGRPVALASFLIDARNWPADPEPFKRTNIALHLVNGALLYWLLCCLDGRNNGRPFSSVQANFAALFATAMWLLHPLFVSTTLYIVQREAMLPCTFTLLALLGWWYARRKVFDGRPLAGSIMALGAIGLGTLFGVLSKANGALIPVFILIVEYLLVAPVNSPMAAGANAGHKRTYRNAVLAPCWLAAALILAYLASFVIRSLFQEVAAGRDWTMSQRLLTEPRVVWSYLRLLWIPKAYTAGVFNDQVSPSLDLFTPWTTLPSLAGIFALLAVAYRGRRRAPYLSCSIIFFLGGHLVESTSIPLELYFEHRNYVPALLMFWPLGRWLTAPPATHLQNGHRGKWVLAILLVATVGMMTGLNARLWGSESDQATLWARLNPESSRAQANAASAELNQGRASAAEARLRPLLRDHPREVQFAFNLVAARCAQGAVDPQDLAAAANAIRTTRDPGTLIVSWFERASKNARDSECTGLDDQALKELLSAGLQNPNFPPGRRQDLLHIRGTLSMRDGDEKTAAGAFDDGIALDPRESAALEQAAELGSAGFPALGLQHLARFDAFRAEAPKPAFGMPAVHEWVLSRQNYWEQERLHLEATLRSDLAAQNAIGAQH